MSVQREPWAIFKTIVALGLIILCLWAAQWQYHRGVDRHARNTLIVNHIALTPTQLTEVMSTPARYEWQSVTTTGEFDSKQQILLRNRYSDGVYGFEFGRRYTASIGYDNIMARGFERVSDS